VVLAGLGYAAGGLYLRRRLSGVSPLGAAAATMVISAALTLPLAAATAPAAVPSLEPAGAMLALGIAGTGVAFLIFYTLIADVGPARAALVAYLAPAFAVTYGVVLLDERVSVATIAGLVLIVGGSWLAARRPAGEVAAPAAQAPLSGRGPDQLEGRYSA